MILSIVLCSFLDHIFDTFSHLEDLTILRYLKINFSGNNNPIIIAFKIKERERGNLK